MRSILVTGSSGGFGREIAVMLARRGWRVFASMRDTAKRDRVFALAAATGTPISAIDVLRLDVVSDSARAEAVDRVLARTGGHLDAVLHCAGYTTTGFFEDVPAQRCRHVLETNLLGAMDLTQRLLPALRASGRGRIVVLSSNAVNVPHPMFSCYAASKWALEGWCEALAVELRPFGVRVMIFQPGNHNTEFGAHAIPVVPRSSPYESQAGRALPRLAGLARYSRPSYKASLRMCDMLERERPPLRTRLGADDIVADLVTRVTPFALRRRFVENLIGLTESARPTGLH